MGEIGVFHRQLRIHRLLIGATHMPRFRWVVMSPATTLLWRHNQVQKKKILYCLLH